MKSVSVWAVTDESEEKEMTMMQDGVDVYCLPDGAYCAADGKGRSPLDMDECPIGCEVCEGDCYYYHED